MNQELFNGLAMAEVYNALGKVQENLNLLSTEEATQPPSLAMALIFDELSKVAKQYADDYRKAYYAAYGGVN